MDLHTDLRSLRLHAYPARIAGRAITRRRQHSRRLLLNAARCALLWLCFMLVWLTAARAMELVVESIGATVTEPSPSPGSISVVVLKFVNANGSPQQLDCVMASPRVLSPSLL